MGLIQYRDDVPLDVGVDPSQPSTSSMDYYREAEKALIIKWSVFGGLFSLLVLFIVIGHLHARARLRKGLPLLAYHKYLVPASKVPSPYGANVYSHRRVDSPDYYAPPPPAYEMNQPPPPSYQPPGSDSKFFSTQMPESSPPAEAKQQAVPSKKKSILPKSWKFNKGSR